MITRAVVDFAPTTSAFAFANNFPPAAALTIPVPGEDLRVGDVSNGLCGGMVFAVRDFFESRLAPPPDMAAPAPETKLFNYIVDRLVDSLDLPKGPARYFQWMALPDDDLWITRGVRSMSLREEWPRIRREIDRGHPATLGLIRVHSLAVGDLGRNHQVLCFGYEAKDDGSLSLLRIYDPNHPGTDVTLSVTEGNHFTYSTGELTRGFFLTKYERRDPRFLVDASVSAPAFSLTAILARLRAVFPR